MGRYQLTGTEVTLGKGAHETPESSPRNGKFQLTGTEVNMSRTSIQSTSANPKGGQYQLVGTETPLSRKAIKGLGSADHITMSDRVFKQSDNAAERGGKRKR
jgi:hypothetical protein